MAPRALPWAVDSLGFQPAPGRRQGSFRTISTYLIFQFCSPFLSHALPSPSIPSSRCMRLVLIAPSALALEIHLQRFQQRAVFRFEFGK